MNRDVDIVIIAMRINRTKKDFENFEVFFVFYNWFTITGSNGFIFDL